MRAAQRNLLVLHLGVGGNGELRGEFWRPRDFVLSPGVVDHIKGPAVLEPASDMRFEHGGLTFTVTKPDNPDDKDRMLLKLTGSQQGELLFDAIQALSMSVVRVEAGAKVAEDWRPGRSYTVARNTQVDIAPNAEMTRLFDADQAARKTDHIEWSVVGKQDEERRKVTARLLAAGSLVAADDFFHAAFIFQHGIKPEDFLLAHTLAMVAVKKGRQDAVWIAGATLDRYLQTVGRPQIFGTQFDTLKEGKTQEPYDRSLISDALRAELDVPSLAEQETQRAAFERQGRK